MQICQYILFMYFHFFVARMVQTRPAISMQWIPINNEMILHDTIFLLAMLINIFICAYIQTYTHYMYVLLPLFCCLYQLLRPRKLTLYRRRQYYHTNPYYTAINIKFIEHIHQNTMINLSWYLSRVDLLPSYYSSSTSGQVQKHQLYDNRNY